MNKLEEYRNNLLEQDVPAFDHEGHYGNNMVKKGFDAAIALDLPIKFLDWCANNAIWRNGSEGSKWYSITGAIKEDKTTKELYQYWIENIYKPE